MFALKRWWWLPVLTTLALVAAMWVVGRSIEPKASAQLLLTTTGSGYDQQAIARSNASVLAQIQASNAFDVAANQAGLDPQDLRQRTRVGMSGESAIVLVEVAAPTAELAAQQANAVANAAVVASEARLRAELDALTAATSRLIETPQLRSETAERARTDALSARLATSQGDLVASTGQLSLIRTADPAFAATPPAMSLMLVGAVGGLLLGLLLVFQLLRRRGRIRSLDEAAKLFPDLDAVGPDEVPRLVDDSVDTIVLAQPTGAAAGSSPESDVIQALEAVGIPVRTPIAGAPGRGAGTVALLSTTPMDALRRQRATALLLWPVHLGRTTAKELDNVVRRTRGRAALLVVDPDRPGPRPARDRAHAGR